MGRRRKGLPIHGWVVLDKPEGLGSTQAVGRVRRAFEAQKAGHAGTLDPLATGVLPIALGEATKTVSFLMDADKAYRFTIAWGANTASFDRDGAITETSDVRPSPEAVAEALPAFVGEIAQIPPAFSAIKVGGERAYDLARAAVAFDLAPRTVTVHSAQVTAAPPTPTTSRSRSPAARAPMCAAWRATWRSAWAPAATSRRCAARGSGRSGAKTP